MPMKYKLLSRGNFFSMVLELSVTNLLILVIFLLSLCAVYASLPFNHSPTYTSCLLFYTRPDPLFYSSQTDHSIRIYVAAIPAPLYARTLHPSTHFAILLYTFCLHKANLHPNTHFAILLNTFCPHKTKPKAIFLL